MAGGNGRGPAKNQLNAPRGIFVDKKDETLYVADCDNHRVMKFTLNSKYGVIVAGGKGQGNGLNQLNSPTGIFVAEDDSIFITGFSKHRVTKWDKGADFGVIVAGGNGMGSELNQLN